MAFAFVLLGSALSSLLVDHGWVVEAGPGRRLMLRRGDRRFDPFAEIGSLLSGRTTLSEWTAICRALELSGPLLSPGLADVAAAVAVPETPANTRSLRRRRGW